MVGAGGVRARGRELGPRQQPPCVLLRQGGIGAGAEDAEPEHVAGGGGGGSVPGRRDRRDGVGLGNGMSVSAAEKKRPLAERIAGLDVKSSFRDIRDGVGGTAHGAL